MPHFFAPDQTVARPLQAGDIFSIAHGPDLHYVFAFERDAVGDDHLLVDVQERCKGAQTVVYARHDACPRP